MVLVAHAMKYATIPFFYIYCGFGGNYISHLTKNRHFTAIIYAENRTNTMARFKNILFFDVQVNRSTLLAPNIVVNG